VLSADGDKTRSQQQAARFRCRRLFGQGLGGWSKPAV